MGLGSETPKNVFIGPHDSDPQFDATLNVQGNAYISETLEIGSSRTRKEKIRGLELAEALETLEGLKPVEFHYLEDPEAQLGFIAEDVPDAVATAERKSVRPMDFVAVLTKMVRDHERRSKAQEQRETKLLERLEDQARQIDELSQRLKEIERANAR